MTTDALSHVQAFELIPWLVNGTLDDEQREQVERHVATCLVCRSELKSQSMLQTFVKEQPTVSWSADTGYERLSRRLDATKPARADRAASRGLRSARWLPAPARLGVAAAVVAALVIAVWLGSELPDARGPGDFTTLTETADGSALLIDIVFAADVTEADRRALLDELGAEMVAGPSDIGRVTVRLNAQSTSARDALIATLQADPRVRFAARNFTLESAETR